MKILVINPNSSPAMTADIDRCAKAFANGEFQVDTVLTPGAPPYIDTYQDAALACPGMMQIVRENEEAYDAFVVACHCDPNLDVLKEMTDRLVVGIGEASMKMATMLGHRFSVISVGSRSTPIKEEVIRRYRLEGCAGPVRAPEDGLASCREEELFLDAAKKAIEEDMAEVIVLGCAGMCGLDKTMEKALGVPVLDGVTCALILASGMVKAGIATSKKRRYAKN